MSEQGETSTEKGALLEQVRQETELLSWLVHGRHRDGVQAINAISDAAKAKGKAEAYRHAARYWKSLKHVSSWCEEQARKAEES